VQPQSVKAFFVIFEWPVFKPIGPGSHQITKESGDLPLEALLTAVVSDYSPNMVLLTETGHAEEAGWIARAQQANTQAFESLYRMHVDRVYGLCLRMTGNVSEAEDCTQEAFIQAWNKLDKFRGDSAFGTWLHRIAVNAVLGRMRKSKREQDRIQVVADTSFSPVVVADTGELRDLSDAVDRLPEGARHVFVLYAVYGYSHDEAGRMLGIASGTSKAQLHRARRLLAQQLEEETDE
jgi:RNA polymerase sigma-70 factor (ECF subfamily)